MFFPSFPLRPMVAAALLCVPLSGCFDVNVHSTFGDDGQAKVVTVMKVSASLLAMQDQKAQQQPFCDSSKMKSPSQDVTRKLKLETVGPDKVCTITLSGTNEAILSAMEKSNSPIPMATNGQTTDPTKPQYKSSLTRSGDVVEWKLFLPPSDSPMTTSKDDSELQKSMRQAMLAAMANDAVVFSITAPQIISTTGRLSDDGHTASLDIPLSDVMTSSKPWNFRVKFRLHKPSLVDRALSVFSKSDSD